MRSVRFLVVLIWSSYFGTLAVALEPDPSKVLEEAQEQTRQGKYEEALQKHLWYHENAVKLDPAQTGVRLSFALSYWIELGAKYPKAKEALVGIRDRDTKAIREGNGSFELFHDVSSINRELKEEVKTVALFKTIDDKYPDLAKRCYQIVEKVLASQREYKLCIRYIGDPVARFGRIQERRAMNLKLAKELDEHLKEYAEKTFVEETCRLIDILIAADRKTDAENIRERALAVSDVPAIRQAVKKAVERK